LSFFQLGAQGCNRSGDEAATGTADHLL